MSGDYMIRLATEDDYPAFEQYEYTYMDMVEPDDAPRFRKGTLYDSAISSNCSF